MDVLVGTVAGVFDLEGRPRFEGSRVAHVTHGDDAWWGVSDSGLLRDGEVVAPPPPNTTLNCVASTGNRVWVGGDSARLFFLDNGKLTEDEAFLRASGRETWHTPWGGPPDVRSMAVGADGTLYVNVHVGGILRHEGDGFVPTLDIHSDVHQVFAHPDRAGVVVAATARGLATSTGGSDFSFRTGGLDHSYCRAVALDGETVLVSASRGPGGGGARLYVGALDDGELRPVEGLGVFDRNLDTHCLLARHGAYFVGHGPTVWSSTDGGETWQATADGLPTVTSLS